MTLGAAPKLRPLVTLGMAFLAASLVVSACDRRPVEPRAGPKAFPTAEGFGANARGGRGGDVHQVVNLDDSGPGSLRACVEAGGPRTCVFRVSGTIDLASSLVIKEPYITIAGQTAPGDGITLRNGSNNPFTPLVIDDTHDVIIRYIRSRPGPSDVPSSSLDALQIVKGSRDVIIDHVSLSWAVDEVFSIYPEKGREATDITLQWSILAEGLDYSTHIKARHHSKGILLVSGKEQPIDARFSLHHNLVAHNRDRMPDLNFAGLVDYVNNVMYNARSEFGEIRTSYGDVNLNFVGNYIKSGPNTSGKAPGLDLKPEDPANTFRVYLADNVGPRTRSAASPPEALLKEDDRGFVVAERHPAAPVETTSAAQAFEDVLRNAGAIRPRRDDVDARIVGEVEQGRGQVIDHPDEVGGWPVLNSAPPPVDQDQDGMADDWETANGLDPTDPDDRNNVAGSEGYTNLENYLNELAAR